MVCGHTVCPECCREEQMRGDYLVCSRCEEVTLLEVETLERIRQVHLNPETSMRYGRGQELEVAFLHCIEGIEKSFKYLHEQLNLKAQALIHNITQVYEAEVQKMRVMSRTLKDSRDSSTSNPFPQSSSKLLRMLKGNQYSLDITPLQTNIMQLTFNLSNGPYLHKYPRCSHQSKREEKEKREKSTQFMKDKSYTRIMGILNKSRSTLDTNLKNIKRSIHFRSTEGPKLDAVNRKSDDSFD